VSRARPIASVWSEARTVVVRGLSYRVRIAGPAGAPAGATPVILLHGFAGSSRDWEEIAGALGGAGHLALAVDLPGHGESAAPADPWRYGAEDMCADLLEILAGTGSSSAHWAGYSMGGRLALYLALSHPERVASLVLESASPGIEEARERDARRAADESFARAIETRGIDWFAEYWAARPLFASQARLPAEVRERLRAARLANRAEGLAGSLRGFGHGVQPWLGEHLGGIECPTLLLTGGLDEKYDDLGWWMSIRIPHARARSEPGAGHNIHLEQPETYALALLEHLAGSVRHATGPATSTH